jgi:hypothetical protein
MDSMFTILKSRILLNLTSFHKKFILYLSLKKTLEQVREYLEKVHPLRGVPKKKFWTRCLQFWSFFFPEKIFCMFGLLVFSVHKNFLYVWCLVFLIKKNKNILKIISKTKNNDDRKFVCICAL